MPRIARFGADFLADRRGGVAVMFGLMVLGIVLAAGMAVDYGRLVHTKMRIAQAADAAALAAGRALLDGRMSESDVKKVAERFFEANLADGGGFAPTPTPSVRVERATGEVYVDATASVPMTLTRIAGYTSVDVPVSAVTRFDDRDIELSLALDVTGSMKGSAKIGALKTATKELIDILLPDHGTTNKVRVALAPFSSGVDAGDYGEAITGRRKGECTFEREGSDPAGDQAPGPENYLKTKRDRDINNNANCPRNAEVIALTDDKRRLKEAVERYEAEGNTAGHLGAMWGSYLLSPHWSGVFGGQSTPVAYNDRKTVKAMMLMSDGEFNTFGGYSGRADDSEDRAVKVCERMRSKSILVFTVGFALDEIPNRDKREAAKKILLDCAGSPDRYFDAEDEDELRAAFTRIAGQINNLRLTH